MKRTIIAAACTVMIVATCKIRMAPADHVEPDIAFPCESVDTCPAPDHACLLSTCMDGQCVFVPAPNGVLPEEDQVIGDCKQRYCDGDGDVVAYAAQLDLPRDAGNPCTQAVCDLDIAKQEPKMAGTRCDLPQNEVGLCNGGGTCGVCLPGTQRCEKQRVLSCQAEGRWGEAVACASKKPVCADGACIGVVELAAGAEHNCARFDNGSVRCWGNASRGRLGNGGISGARTPSWASGFSTVASGPRHQCGIRHDGTVWCWGLGDLGQLGQGTHLSSAAPVETGLQAVGLAVGRQHSCAIVAGGTVKCWGRNDLGQLGSGRAPAAPLSREAIGPAREAQGVPILIDGLSDARALNLDGSKTCVRRAGGQLICWGLSPPTRPAPAPTTPDDAGTPETAPGILQATRSAPTTVMGVSDAVELDCGSQHCCVRTKTGGAMCWGSGERGALGNGATANSFKAVAVSGVADARRLAVGSQFACVLRNDNSVMCWGANDLGQLGTGTNKPFDMARVIATLGSVQSLTVSAGHACALVATGELACWGDNGVGQLGRSVGKMARAPGPVQWQVED